MPGRIVYIRNPKSGSHFRTMPGKSASQGVPTWNGTRWTNLPKGRKRPTGSAYNLPTGENYGGWANFGDPLLETPPMVSNNPYAGMDFGTLPGYGVGPYQAPTFEDFQPAETLFGQLYDIATGVDPYTGQHQQRLFAPGTLQFNPLNFIGFDQAYARQSIGLPGSTTSRGTYNAGSRIQNKKRPSFLK